MLQNARCLFPEALNDVVDASVPVAVAVDKKEVPRSAKFPESASVVDVWMHSADSPSTTQL
jgi:hypothetical protein